MEWQTAVRVLGLGQVDWMPVAAVAGAAVLAVVVGWVVWWALAGSGMVGGGMPVLVQGGPAEAGPEGES